MPEQKPSTVLVTGGCGYLGSQLIRDLASQAGFEGWKIRILDNMQGGFYRGLMNLPASGRYEFIEGDILDPNVVQAALRGVEAVIHLAAVVRTPMSFEHPTWVEQVNHWGTARLIQSCLDNGITRFIYTSSLSVFGPGGPYTENDPCRPLGPYAMSKFRAEREVMEAVPRGLNPTILRLGTIFGVAPVMRFDAVANRLAYLTGIGRSLTIYGRGDQLRPFIHVADASQAVLFSLGAPQQTSGELFNVFTENISIVHLVEVLRAIKPHIQVHYTEQDVLTHLSFEADGSKLRAFGWQPQVALRAGLAELVSQFQNIQQPFGEKLPVELE